MHSNKKSNQIFRGKPSATAARWSLRRGTGHGALAVVFIGVTMLLTGCFQVIFDNPYDPQSVHNGKPVIVLNGGVELTMVLNDSFEEVDPGVIIKDDADDDSKLKKLLKIVVKKSSGETIDSKLITKSLGHYSIEYYCTDSDNNESNRITRTIRVVEKKDVKDTIPPVIFISGGAVELGAGEQFKEPGCWAIDNPGREDVSARIEKEVLDEGGSLKKMDLFSKQAGTYSIYYGVADNSKNPAIKVKRTVVVKQDVTPPVLTLKGDTIIRLMVSNIPFVDPGFTAFDNVDGDLTKQVKVEGEVTPSTAGTYTVTYRVTDRAGNSSEKKRVVIVQPDTKAPEITLRGANPMYVEYGSQYKEPGATAMDDIDGDITSLIAIEEKIIISKLGEYIVKYSAKDKAGNIGRNERKVIVRDTVAPKIILNGPNPINLAVEADFVDPGAIAIDNCDGDLSSKIKVTGTVDTKKVGKYTLTYSVSDLSGNKKSEPRTVNVIEQP